MAMQAKMSGKCKVCGGDVLMGEWITYDPNAKRGEKVAHVACAKGEPEKKPLSAAEIAMKLAERIPEGKREVGLTVKQVTWLFARVSSEHASELERAERSAGSGWRRTEEQERRIEYLRASMPKRRAFDVDLPTGEVAQVHVWPNGAGFLRIRHEGEW